VPGGRREVVDALCDGGPTKSAGAGNRFDCVLLILLLDAISGSGGRFHDDIFDSNSTKQEKPEVKTY